MRRTVAIVGSAAAIAAASFGLAFAQNADQSPAPQQISQVTCGNLTGLSDQYRTALVYYAAGYQQGAFDTQTAGKNSGEPATAADVATSASSELPDAAPLGTATATTELGTVTVVDPALTSAQSSAAASASSALAPSSAEQGQPIVGGLQLNAQAVLDACAGTPDALLANVIAANGGTAVSGSPGVTPTTGSSITTTGSGGATTTAGPQPQGTGTAPSGEVSNDLNQVSQQLNNSIVSNQIDSAAPPAGAAPATPDTTMPPATTSP